MSEWKIIVRLKSATGDHDDFEEEWNDVLPDAVLMTLLSGSFRLRVRGMCVYMGLPSIDFQKRRFYMDGETFQEKPEARP